MSDNPFSELLGSFKRGWDAAGSVENLSTQRVRSRPSFWNPFHTWRDEEERQLAELYDEVRSTFEASPFMEAELFDQTITKIIVNACQAIECSPSRELIVAMHNVVKTLIYEEFFVIQEFNEQDWPKQLDVETAMQIRRALERKRRFLNDADQLFETGCHKIIIIIASLLELLPESFQQNDDQNDNSPSMSFRVELVDIIGGPVKAIESTVSTFYDKDLVDGELFVGVRGQFEHNLYAASGLDPGNKNVSEKQLIMPSETKGKTPSELAETYLKDTPFADFFSHSLPMQIPDQARFEHCHILGGTGHGKTQCLQYLLHEDLCRAVEDKLSLVVIDSQGDLIRKLSSNALFHPGEELSLSERFILIDPSDIERPPALSSTFWVSSPVFQTGTL